MIVGQIAQADLPIHACQVQVDDHQRQIVRFAEPFQEVVEIVRLDRSGEAQAHFDQGAQTRPLHGIGVRNQDSFGRSHASSFEDHFTKRTDLPAGNLLKVPDVDAGRAIQVARLNPSPPATHLYLSV